MGIGDPDGEGDDVGVGDTDGDGSDVGGADGTIPSCSVILN